MCAQRARVDGLARSALALWGEGMTFRTVHQLLRLLLLIVPLLALPAAVAAQEATIIGTVTDESGGALPGVTVQAVHSDTGTTFEAVTDVNGSYRLPLRIGRFVLRVELPGFAPLTQAVLLQVGQQAVINLQLSISGVQEAVTVSAEAPLLDATRSSIRAHIDRRQMEGLPLNGRNWMELTALVPGMRNNSVAEVPYSLGTGAGRVQGNFQVNVDGQQISSSTGWSATYGQPHYSLDAIAEFEMISSRFDATQGRSTSVQVNVVTRSGTNVPGGSFGGYFRHDKLNAADFVAKRVLDYSNQQLSGTFGGPIRKDRIHLFVNTEWERQPATMAYATPYPRFNEDLHVLNTEWKAGTRLDAQLTTGTRFSARISGYDADRPGFRSSSFLTQTPSTASGVKQAGSQYLASVTHVLNNRALNETKFGYHTSRAYSGLSNVIAPGSRTGYNGVQVQLRGLTTGGNNEHDEKNGQDTYVMRDDFTYTFAGWGGQHTFKSGGEYIYNIANDSRCAPCDGSLDATGGPIPANIEDLFPNQYDASTWNLQPLSPIAVRWTQAFGNGKGVVPRHTYAFWVQDDWIIHPRLTLNLGVRYDLELNAYANDIEVDPRFLPAGQPNDTNNVGPRGGFSFSLNDRTLVRGGSGIFFSTVTNAQLRILNSQMIITSIENDGRPDFASNPWNGPAPTYEQLLARICTPEAPTAPGCIRRQASSTIAQQFVTGYQMPHSIQSSIGFQRQIGSTSMIEADYVYQSITNLPYADPNINLSYNPETGANYPFADISRRPYPDWGVVVLSTPGRRFTRHSLDTSFTKRLSNTWQASGTYTLAWEREMLPRPWSGTAGGESIPAPIDTAVDFGGQWGRAPGDQRHRATANAIWQLPVGFQVSGMYFYGSGQRYSTFYGVDLRQMGTNSGSRRLRPDGSIIPLANFQGLPIHRVDMQFQRRFVLWQRAHIDAIAALFNVFNHANYGSYNLNEVSATYGQPVQDLNNAYQPRRLQLGFRMVF